MPERGDAIVRHVVTFGRVLREVGLEVGPGRTIDALRALDAVDLTRQEDVYFALRQTLVSRHDELDLFDRAFLAWFLRPGGTHDAEAVASLIEAVNRRPIDRARLEASLADAPATEPAFPVRPLETCS